MKKMLIYVKKFNVLKETSISQNPRSNWN